MKMENGKSSHIQRVDRMQQPALERDMLENIIRNGNTVNMTTNYNDCDIAVKKILVHVGKNITIAVPLGIGKPIGFLNALYRLAVEDKSITLTILTGLTLVRPIIINDLEKRFITPIIAKILGDYEDLLYELDRKKQQLPENINVIEFFFTPGNYLKNNQAQQNYISANYTDALCNLFSYPINIIAQQVAHSSKNPNDYSLSCNTDLFYEAAKQLRSLETSEKKIAIVAEVNNNLPFMLGSATIKPDEFSDIINTKNYRSLFSLPKPKLTVQDHLIGLYTSTLIKDESCIQIGIGKLTDAIAHALILRHKENSLYQEILKQLKINNSYELSSFDQGLYTSTEMLSDGCMHLYKERILKKRVYDHIGLQTLLNSKKITETITDNFLDILIENNIIHRTLTENDVRFLHEFGILKKSLVYKDNRLFLPSGESIPADLTSISVKEIILHYLGKSLQSGKIIHAGFFIGSNDFYRQLKELSIEELQQIEMTSIFRTNTLCWSHELSTLQRRQARFINSAMMVTLEGAIISDGLTNWQEVSGVGGQFDFAIMRQKLSNSRFIINCHSTRYDKGKIRSNIVWDYPNITLPRNLRDIIITEYGIADCFGKKDSDIIKAILNITDSRFQKALLKKAKKYGKIESSYEIPSISQQNFPKTLQPIIQELQNHGYGQPYPFGCELTEEEKVLENALLFLKNNSKLNLFFTLCKSLFFLEGDTSYHKYLNRMGLTKPKSLKDFIYKKLLKYIIHTQANKKFL
jgi:hypothetical protein